MNEHWLIGNRTIMDEKTVEAWKTMRSGRLVCGFCGHHFEAGDPCRFRISVVSGFWNHFVCSDCDDEDEILDKIAKQRVEELFAKFAWRVDDDEYRNHHWRDGKRVKEYYRNPRVKKQETA